KLLDVRGALDVLPALPLGRGQGDREAVRATGTEAVTPAHPVQTSAPEFAPGFAPTRYKPGQWETTADKAAREGMNETGTGVVAANPNPDKREEPLTTPVSGPAGVGATGLEPVTPSVSSMGAPDATVWASGCLLNKRFSELAVPEGFP